MIDTSGNMLTLAEKRDAQLTTVMEKLFSAAQPGVVYGEPVTAGNYTIISASEVSAGGGFGSGLGIGAASSTHQEETSPSQAQPNNGGGGMGGGGGSNGRPVAIIVVGPDGVSVQPVVDVTKIALAGVTVWGSMLMVLRGMRRMRKR